MRTGLILVVSALIAGCGRSTTASSGDSTKPPETSDPQITSPALVTNGPTPDDMKAAGDAIAKSGLPSATILPTAAPTTLQELWIDAAGAQALAIDLKVSEGVKTAVADKAERSRFRKELAQRQAKLFPALRRAYLDQLKYKMWLTNVDMELRGSGGRTLRFTGAMFTDNAAIAGVEDAALSSLRSLRFSKVEYAWYNHGPATVYDLQTPSDRAIGYQQYGRFVAVQ